MKANKKYVCPICESKTLSMPYGSFDICSICGWEEDGFQQRYPDLVGINGKWTLNEAKKTWENGKPIYDNFPHK